MGTMISWSQRTDDIFRPFYPSGSLIIWVVIAVCPELFSKAP